MPRSEEDYTRAIELNPRYIHAYYSRAEARHALGKEKEALEDARQVLKLSPPLKSQIQPLIDEIEKRLKGS